MTKKQGPVEKILRKRRRWFRSEDRLVKNWFNTTECDNKGNVCRACILGAVDLAYCPPPPDPLIYPMISPEQRARDLLARAAGKSFRFSSPHKLNVVHRIYDKAIADAHIQGI